MNARPLPDMPPYSPTAHALPSRSFPPFPLPFCHQNVLESSVGLFLGIIGASLKAPPPRRNYTGERNEDTVRTTRAHHLTLRASRFITQPLLHRTSLSAPVGKTDDIHARMGFANFVTAGEGCWVKTRRRAHDIAYPASACLADFA
jgi:hypothetical protein